jgi:hypothetical protein
MPFLRSSTRPQAVECFFCLSTALLAPETAVAGGKGKERVGQPGTRWNWHCRRCGCWNIRDEVCQLYRCFQCRPADSQRGEMVSDVPAMHNSALNESSFSLRGELGRHDIIRNVLIKQLGRPNQSYHHLPPRPRRSATRVWPTRR